MSNTLPYPQLPGDMRIGHRGLEHRQIDDSFWLNGTQIDSEIYNVELQRIIAHQAEQKTNAELRHAQLLQNADMQNIRMTEQQQQALINRAASIGMRMDLRYGYAPFEATAPPQTSAPSRDEKRAEVPQTEEAATRARLIAEGRLPKGGLSLKTSPLFGFMRWTFHSPLKPLHDRLIRFAWNLQRSGARSL